MIFTSQIFLLWFLPSVLLLYYLTSKRWRSGLLVGLSYVFYGWWRLDFVLLMLISTVVDYWCGRKIAEKSEPVDRKRFLVLSMCTNLGANG